MGQKYAIIVFFFSWVILLFQTPASAQNISLEQEGSPFAEEGGSATIIASTDLIDNTNDIIVNIDFSGDAVAGTDFSAEGNSITIPAGAETGSITLTGLTDDIYEGTETLTATISTVSGGTASIGSPASVNLDISDPEDLPEVTISASPETVGENTETVELTAELSNPSVQTITLDLGVTGGTANSDDYNFADNQVSFISLSTAELASIDITDDLIYELSETLTIGIIGVSAGEVNSGATTSLTLTIDDNESIPVVNLSTTTASVEEGQSTNITGTISPATYEAVTVNLFANTVTASAADYNFTDEAVVIPAGETQFQYSIAAIDDNLSEPTETLSVEISSVIEGGASPGSTTIQSIEIIDTDETPSISMSAATSTIAESGGEATITVSVDPPAFETITVNIGATGGTASGADYSLSASQISLTATQPSQTVTLTGLPDEIYEGTETLTLELSNPSGGNAVIESPGTLNFDITDDENAPQVTLSADPTSITEGSSSTLTISMSAKDTQEVTVTLSANNGTASSDDYTFTDNTVVFAAGETEKEVTITANTDEISEPDETFSISITNVTGGSAFYTSPEAEELTITDNNGTPTISMSTGTNTFSEENGSSTITVSIDPPASETVSVNIGPAGGSASGADYSLSASQVSLTATQPSQTVTLTGLPDEIYEGTETLTLELSNPSGGNAVIESPGTLDFDITDDENAPQVTLSADPTSITEGSSSTLTISMSAKDTQEVTVTLSANNGTASSDDYTFTDNTVVFAAGETEKEVTITTNTDDISEPDETFSIEITNVTGGSAFYTSPEAEELTITDNNGTPTISMSASTSTIAESGGEATITVSVNPPASETVTVNIGVSGGTASTGDYDLSQTNISFAPEETSKEVTLTGNGDSVYEGNETLTLQLTDPTGGGSVIGSPATLNFEITDDESIPELSLSAGSTSFAENESTTITATLSPPSSQDIIVNLNVSNQSAESEDYSVSANSVTIAAGNTTATSIISGEPDDFYEGNELLDVFIGKTSGGEVNTGSNTPVTLTITDIQTPPAVSLSVSPSTIMENGSSTITATLSNPTFEEVTVSLLFTDEATLDEDFSLSSPNIVIPAQAPSGSITLNGIDDNIYENSENLSVAISNVSGGSATENGNQQQTIVLSDNDSAPMVSLTASPLSISENSFTTLTVSLSNPTTENVLVNLAASSSNASENDYILSATSVTITASNQEATTTLEAIPDNIFEGNEEVVVSISAAAGGGASVDGTQEVTITIEDAQTTPVVALSFTGTPFSEDGGEAELIAELNYASYQPVTVNLTYSGTTSTSDYSGAQDQVIIPAGSVSESISITGENDLNAEGDETIVVTITSVENALEDGIQEVSATILDDDVPGIKPTIFDANTITSEDGSSDSFTVQLNTQPTSNVVIEITGLDDSEGTLSISELTFTPDNWNQTQLVNITGVNDNEVDGNITYTLILTVNNNLSDAAYHNIETTVEVTNNDNDSAGFDLSITNSHTQTNETGTRDVFTVVLLSQPTSDVVFSISGLDETEGTLSTSELTFTPANWNTQQTVTITGVNDDEVDGNTDYTLTIAVVDEQSDATYHGQSETLLVTNIDDDAAGIVVTISGETLTIDESGTNSSFDISLSSRPTSDVVISISGLDTSEGSLDKDQLTFTPDNWNQSQTVTLTGLDDFLVDGDISFTLLLAVENNLSSSDYHDLTSQIPATNTDDDEAAIVVSRANDQLQTSESGEADSFTVRLNSQPLNHVVIDISGLDASEGSLNSTELIFSQDNWNEDQTVTITGVDDAIVDGNIEYTLTLAVNFVNSDVTYRGLSNSLVVTNTDNDEPTQNQAPVPVNDSFEMLQFDILEGTSLLDNDSDPDDDILNIDTTPATHPENGTVTISGDGTFVYQPHPEFTGTDTFEYRVCDDGTPSLCDTATVSITVNTREMNPIGDSDNDGIPDMTEGDGDCDNDGIPDWYDTDPCYEEFEITRGFSPNGDGISDEFNIPWLHEYDRVGIVIFNRWGAVVFKNEHLEPNDSWDGIATSGISKGKGLPAGTYYYIITIYDTNKTLKGYLYLAR